MASLDELPAVLRSARKARGLPQVELAAKACVSRSTIMQLESGAISDLGFRKLANVLLAVGLELSVRPLQGLPTLTELNRINAVAQDRALRETDVLVAALQSGSIESEKTQSFGYG